LAQVSDVRFASFKTVERQSLSLVGSIPIRLSHCVDDVCSLQKKK